MRLPAASLGRRHQSLGCTGDLSDMPHSDGLVSPFIDHICNCSVLTLLRLQHLEA